MQEEQIMYRGSKTFSPALRCYTWYTQVLRTVNSHYTQKGSQPLQPNCAMGSSEKNANYTGRTASCSGSQAVPLLTFPCLHVLLGAGTWVGTQWGACSCSAPWAHPSCPAWAAQTLQGVQNPGDVQGFSWDQYTHPRSLDTPSIPCWEPQAILEHLHRTRGVCSHSWVRPASYIYLLKAAHLPAFTHHWHHETTF